MSIQLSQSDRAFLERLAVQTIPPTRRQKIQALLALTLGERLDSVSQRFGIPEDQLAELVDQYNQGGIERVFPRSHWFDRLRNRRRSTVVKTPGVCGGDARIDGTRIPVWQLVEARNAGAGEAQLLIDFPRLTARNLVDAWDYANDHPDEIAAAIRENEVV